MPSSEPERGDALGWVATLNDDGKEATLLGGKAGVLALRDAAGNTHIQLAAGEGGNPGEAKTGGTVILQDGCRRSHRPYRGNDRACGPG